MKTIYFLSPLSKRASKWIKENLIGEQTKIGTSIIVEHRYISDIVEAIKECGLIKDFSIA